MRPLIGSPSQPDICPQTLPPLPCHSEWILHCANYTRRPARWVNGTAIILIWFGHTATARRSYPPPHSFLCSLVPRERRPTWRMVRTSQWLRQISSFALLNPAFCSPLFPENNCNLLLVILDANPVWWGRIIGSQQADEVTSYHWEYDLQEFLGYQFNQFYQFIPTGRFPKVSRLMQVQHNVLCYSGHTDWMCGKCTGFL